MGWNNLLGLPKGGLSGAGTKAFIGPWIRWYPEILGLGAPSPLTTKFYYRVEGDTIRMFGAVTAGTTTGAQFTISMPNKWKPEKEILGITSTVYGIVGNHIESNAGNPAGSVLVLADSNLMYFGVQAAAPNGWAIPINGNFYASGNIIHLNAVVPIQELQ